jgi:tellurite resistance protein TehA-like permease
MKKDNFYLLAAVIFCYIATAFVTLQINPLKWDPAIRIIFALFAPVFVGLVYTFPRDTK